MKYIQEIKYELFRITNELRSEIGIPIVSYSNHLERMGQIHTNEMYTRNFFNHENKYCKRVGTLTDRINYCGLSDIFDLFGENLADIPTINNILKFNLLGKLLTPLQKLPVKILCVNIIKGLYNSPGHRANLLNHEFNFMGFGVLLYPKVCHGIKIKYLLITQVFGRLK